MTARLAMKTRRFIDFGLCHTVDMLIALLLFMLSSASVGGQEKETAGQKESSKPPQRGDTVIARGCLTGSVLESAELTKAGGTDRFPELLNYRLTGDKKTMEEIRKVHAGHADVLTAELKTALPKSTDAPGKQVGNTRITIRGGSSRGMGPEPPPPLPVLRVTSVEHTGMTCR
jgi:hypothetical protein